MIQTKRSPGKAARVVVAATTFAGSHAAGMDRTGRLERPFLARGGRPLVFGLAAWWTLVAGGCVATGRQDYQRPTRIASTADSSSAVPLIAPVPLGDQAVRLPPAKEPAESVAQQDRQGADGIQQAAALVSAEEVPESIQAVPAEVDPRVPPPPPLVDSPNLARIMTLEEAMTYALDHHPLLRARQYEVEIAHAKLISAQVLPNPQFVVDAESPFVATGAKDLTSRLMFTIPIGRKRRLRKAVACAAIERARLTLSRETQRILEEAADAGVEVLYLQELLEIDSQISRLTEKQARATAPAMVPGQPELRLAKRVAVDTAVVKAEAKRLDTNAQLAVARRRLASAIGLPPPAVPIIHGTLAVGLAPLMPLESVLALARRNRPELAEAHAAVVQSQQEHALAHAEALPDPEIGPRYNARFGEPKDRLGMRIGMDLPLFDQNQGAICQTAAQMRASRALLSVTELNTLSDVASAYAELAAVQKSLRFFNGRVAQLTKTTNDLLKDPTIQQGISDFQESEIRLSLAKMRLNRLELQHRYQQLLTHLTIFLSQPITLACQTETGPI